MVPQPESATAAALPPDLAGCRLLTRQHVAELLGVEVPAVLNLARIGALPAVKVGRTLVWKPETVRLYIEGLEPGT